MLGHSGEGLQVASDDGVSKQASFLPIVPAGNIDDIGFDNYGSGAAIDRAIVQRCYGAIVLEPVVAVHDPEADDVAVLVQNFEALRAVRGGEPRYDPDMARTAHVAVALHRAMVNKTLVPLRAIEAAHHGPHGAYRRPDALHYHGAALVARCPHRVVAPHRLVQMMVVLQVLILFFADRPLRHHRLLQSLPRLRFRIPILEAAGKVREYPQLVWLTHAWRPSAVLLQKITDRFDPTTWGICKQKKTQYCQFPSLLLRLLHLRVSQFGGSRLKDRSSAAYSSVLEKIFAMDIGWLRVAHQIKWLEKIWFVLDLVCILHKYLLLFFTNT